MGRKKKVEGHMKGLGCDPHYETIRNARKCSCGGVGIGYDQYGTPVCSFHDRFPTQRVRDFPPIPKCPGPHV